MNRLAQRAAILPEYGGANADLFDICRYIHGVKFTDEQIEEIRKLRSEGMSVKELTKCFNIGTSQVYNIINNRQRKRKE